MKTLITLVILAVVLYSNTSCNIAYYKMMSNRDDIKTLKNEIKTNNFKNCMSKADCEISIKSLKDLDKELTKKYHECKRSKE